MQTWLSIIKRVLMMPSHKSITVPINDATDPEKEGAVKTIGEIGVHEADYEFTLEDGGRVHIKKYKNYYEVHWDKVSPLINAIEHPRQDAPHWWILLCAGGGAGLGALITYLISKFLGKEDDKKDISFNTLFGFGGGALLGLLTCNNE